MDWIEPAGSIPDYCKVDDPISCPMNKPICILVALFLSSLSHAGSMTGKTIEGQPSVIDGDTLEIQGTRIRLHGIDAPESSQQCYRQGEPWKCGQWAAQALDSILEGKHLACSKRGMSYNRVVAVCQVIETGQDIAQVIVRGGGAVAARKYSMAYVPAETEAKAEQAGIWSSDFKMPWIWRNGH